MTPIIEAVRDYILTYPDLPEGQVLVDYLGGEAGQFTIEPMPCDPIFKRYTDGGCQKQYLFLLASRQEYGADLEPCVENEFFYEKFARWLEKNSRAGILPDMGTDRIPISMEALTGGYALIEDTNTARYQIQLRLIYEEE